MTVRNLATLDRTVFQPLGRILQEAFSDGFNATGLPHWGSAATPCTVATGLHGLEYRGKVTAGTSDGIAAYLEGYLSGAATGSCYGVGIWFTVDAAAVASNEAIPLDVGIYANATCDLSGAIVAAGKFQTYIPAGSPPSMHVQFWFNTDQSGDVPDAWFNAANAEAVCFAGGAGAGTKNGSVCIMINSAKKYIYTYDSPNG